MRTIVAIIAVSLLLHISFAIAADTPSEVVRKFCQLDYQGARLSSDGFIKIQPLIAYPEEPAWDLAIGIKGYKITNENIDGKKAEVVVEYEIDQIVPSDLGILDTEVVELIQSNGVWKIERYVDYPRVSSAVLCTKYKKCE
jgi:hypothetical protein